ncbi:glycosyltransferase [Mycolicibacterium sp. CBMA 226]|uniref:glycosyltransferase n=1 Tax=Mycolicibacterium sp. CBMA 226 TaxID=2606611 RepID=UPI001413457F|nr:glycosyltransferase [Mycolicibacterium sp. CBMA 226]
MPDGILEAVSKRPSIPCGESPFVLAVGRLNVRKNLARLIEAFVRVARDDPKPDLVIAGCVDGAYVPITVPDDMTARIHFLGHVTDNELRWLYENCDLFVCPSLDEGYGLPIIEANILGAQVIASDIQVFRESNIAVGYFDPRSVDEIASAIRHGLDGINSTVAGHLTWEGVVRNIRDVIYNARRHSNAPKP